MSSPENPRREVPDPPEPAGPREPTDPPGPEAAGEAEAPGSAGPGERPPSWGNISEHHWSVARRDMNQEELEYYRERNKAPGVAEGGAERNLYCMQCDGVIPVSYDSTRPAEEAPPEACPHCGAELDARVRRYFNWVEIDQVPAGDFKALLPVLVLGLGVLVLLGWLLMRYLLSP